jgi:dihydropyrimidinase
MATTNGSMLISGGKVVTSAGVSRADVLVRGERIAAIGDPAVTSADVVVDAAGKLVLPGAVDAHTHLDMPVGAARSADDFFTGTIAAACGGTTTVVDFATAYRGEAVAQGLAAWHAKASGRAVIDYAFHMTLTELARPASDIVAEMVEQGVTSFKLYMTYPERLMVSDDVIMEVLKAAGPAGAIVCLHCEDDAIVARRRGEALGRGRRGPRWHAWSRPAHAEGAAVARAARMAEDAQAACYVVHLSSAAGLEQVRLARERGLPIFAETCPQYLYLSSERLEGAPDTASNFVCAPPLRDPRHSEELWEGLTTGALQVVATDHCPFTKRDRAAGVSGRGWTDFTEIPGGLPGVETRLSLIYQKVLEGRLTLEQWVDRCSTAPAKLFGLYPSKGEIAVGSDADVVVFDERAVRPLLPERLHMRVDHSPYAEIVAQGWPALVLCRGRVVARDGEPCVGAGWGRFVRRGRTGASAA